MKAINLRFNKTDYEINYFDSYQEFERCYPNWEEPDYEINKYINLPDELFMIKNADGSYSGIDNRDGEAYTEDFKTYVECINWLLELEEDESVNLLTDLK